MPDPGQAADFIEAVGFPAAVAVVAIALGAAALWFQHRDHQAEIERLTTEHRAEAAYIEARRVEERDGRVKAEQRVTTLTERWDRALTIMGNIERELIRAVSRNRDG